jgi:hypothetical protein
MSVIRPDGVRAELPRAFPGPDLTRREAAALAAWFLHRSGVHHEVAAKALKISVPRYYARLEIAYDVLAEIR